MKLRKVSIERAAGYPSYTEYHDSRPELLRKLAAGAIGLAAAAAVSMAAAEEAGSALSKPTELERPVRLAGVVAPRVTPTPAPTPEAIRLPGEVAPVETPFLRGRIRNATPPPGGNTSKKTK